MTNTLMLTRGLPASGKSTYARKLVSEDPTYIRLNRDDFRQMLFGKAVLDANGEQMVTAAQHGAVDNALANGYNVIVDDTNFFEKGVKALMKIAAKHSAEVVFKDFTDVALDELVRRDEGRRQQGKSNFSSAVGERVIRDMHKRYIQGRQLPLKVPSIGEYELVPYVNRDVHLQTAVIVDIDGTVAKMVSRGPYDWKRVGEDQPVIAVLDMVRDLEYAGNVILFTSGRDGVCRPETEEWLNRHYGGQYQLRMREEGDNRPDWIIKAEIFDKYYRDNYNITMVIDDRGQVVRMWRKLGLTVAQVADGEF